MATVSVSHSGLGFQPGGGVNSGGVGRPTGWVGADDEDERAAQISAAVAASSADDVAGANAGTGAGAGTGAVVGDVPVDTVVVVAVDLADDDLSSRPRCLISDLGLDEGVDAVVDTAAAGVDVVAVVVADVAAVWDFRRQDG